MGREARAKKFRTCKSCGKSFKWDVKVMKYHFDQCSRLNKIGLIAPESSIISLDDRKE